MKNVIIFSLITIFGLMSCQSDKKNKTEYSKYESTVIDEINKYNYDKITYNLKDTIQLVSIDTVVKIGNLPIFSKMVGEDTTTINIIGRVNMVMIGCKVKTFNEGYYKLNDMIISYYEDEPEFLFTSVSDKYSIQDAANNINRGDKVLLSHQRKTMLDIKRNKSL